MIIIPGKGFQIAHMMFGAPVPAQDKARAALTASLRRYRALQATARSVPGVSFAHDLAVVRAAIRRHIAAIREA
jgi:hypothetical protein